MPINPFARLPFIPFMSYRKLWIIISLALSVATLGLLGVHGLNFGIDFVGGKLVQIQTERPLTVAQVRTVVEGAGFKGATIQHFGADNEYLIRLSGNDPLAAPTEAEQTLRAQLEAQGGPADLRRVEFVGPQVGAELRTTGAMAVFLTFLTILAYISLRFEFRYGVGAIVALAHDTLLTVGIMSLLSTEISLTVLAAIMTLIGYSLNDTIVIFDRIRETRARFPNKPLADVMDMGLNQTMARTILTAGTTLLVLVCLMLFGGSVLFDFALVLTIGIILGTYSSIFVAAPVLMAMEKPPAEPTGA